MKIVVGNKELTGKELFDTVWRGYVVGMTVIFIPFALLGLLASIFPNSDESVLEMVLFLVMVPVIAGFQGIMFGGLILLGLKVWPPKKTEVPEQS